MILFENILFTDDAFDLFLEAIEDFPSSSRPMYRFARRKHNDTGAIRKVSKQPYWIHPEGVAYLVMKYGGSDLEIKIALAHDTMEDAGTVYDDIKEKFGKQVADGVSEITNDKNEIAKIGKETYINNELCSISSAALTAKLADILYNLKDSCSDESLIRMTNNLVFCKKNRKSFTDTQNKLLNDGLEFAYEEIEKRGI